MAGIIYSGFRDDGRPPQGGDSHSPSQRENVVPAVHTALVIGAGAAGAASAILLSQAGVSVEVAETKSDVSALGSGITLQGNALRVLRELGVWEDVRAAGYAFDTLGLRAPDPAGTLVAELDEIRTGGDDLPATLGMYRPDLARILWERAQAVGAKCRLGTTVAGFVQDESGVEVTFSDGGAERYDLVIAADGIHSRTRDRPVWGSGGSSHRAPPPSSAPTSSTGGPPTSPATARPARTPSTPTSSRTTRTAPGWRPRRDWP
jgi:glycine/D-amino acid oxidase-like deaminating enzyme